MIGGAVLHERDEIISTHALAAAAPYHRAEWLSAKTTTLTAGRLARRVTPRAGDVQKRRLPPAEPSR
jgi:hypothetical protein